VARKEYQEVDQWLIAENVPASNLFVIYANPGCRKSTFVVHYSHQMKRECRLAASIFFAYNYRKTFDVREVIISLAFQMMENIPILSTSFQTVIETTRFQEPLISVMELFHKIIVYPLKQLTSKNNTSTQNNNAQYNRNWIILLDGLLTIPPCDPPIHFLGIIATPS